MKDGNACSIALCIFYHIVLSIVLLSIVDTGGLIMKERIPHMPYIICVAVFSKLETILHFLHYHLSIGMCLFDNHYVGTNKYLVHFVFTVIKNI